MCLGVMKDIVEGGCGRGVVDPCSPVRDNIVTRNYLLFLIKCLINGNNYKSPLAPMKFILLYIEGCVITMISKYFEFLKGFLKWALMSRFCVITTPVS